MSPVDLGPQSPENFSTPLDQRTLWTRSSCSRTVCSSTLRGWSMGMNHNVNEVIKKAELTDRDIDIKELFKIKVNPEDSEDSKERCIDYSRVVVKKPWGYEYLIFQNEAVAAWILYLKPGPGTSMHCHPNKKTSLIVLENEAVCTTLNEVITRRAGEGLMIHKGAFHQTKTTSKSGAFLMEIESPVNKQDLLRVKDEYGRVGKGYETVDRHAFTHNYNYLTLSEPEVYYNVTKRFGQCTVTLERIKTENDLEDIMALDEDDIFSVLKGTLLDSCGKSVVEVGDTTTVGDLRKAESLRLGGVLEILVVKKHDTVIKISDVIMSFLKSQNVREVFFVPGDANVHMIDSLGRDGELNYTCSQTERVASMAAGAYSKLTSELGVLLISSGASGTNAITGVADAWTDSAPLFVISGQATAEEPSDSGIRQRGNKFLNIIDIVKPITKHAVSVTDPKDIRACLQEAAYWACEGRPGPVWVDIPVDIQGMTIDERELETFEPKGAKEASIALGSKVSEVVKLLKDSKRPVILAGNGIRLSDAENKFLELIGKLGVPILTSRRGADLVPDNHPLFFGRPGAYGQRRANFVIQNSDLLISIGARLSLPQIGRNYKAFARAAKKVIVDIDKKELGKKTLKADVGINASAKDFIEILLGEAEKEKLPDYSRWIEKCREWKKKFPPATGELYEHKEFINPYLFIDAFSAQLEENDVIVVDGGPVMNYVMQTFKFKKGQRMVSSIGVELPGFALPGSIGASIGNGRNQVVCLTEDRGFQVNIQELQTIIDNRLPIKVFVLKSEGHSNIRKIQREYFGGRYIGTDNETIFGSPDLVKVGKIYGFGTFEIKKRQNLKRQIRKVLKSDDPAICVIQVDKDQELIPRIVLNVTTEGKWEARPLEDMYPFLDRETLRENMIAELSE